MEFPFGHHTHTHTHHHQHHDDPEEDERRGRPLPYYSQPPPPPSFGQPSLPPYYQENEYAPPHPKPYYEESHVSHVHHASDQAEGFGSFNHHPQPPPPRSEPAVHVSHVAHHERTETTHHHSFEPHLPSFLHHHSGSDSGKPTVRLFCKAEPNFSLSIRDGKVVLAQSDSSDVYQHWYKDEKYSTRVKDEEGFPAFALVNKATGQAMKHSIGANHPVQLIPYNPDVLDESILWTESKDTGEGYRAVRMVNNIRLNVDAFLGDNGGVHDGTTIGLWNWNKGDNQRWKIIPYCKFFIRESKTK